MEHVTEPAIWDSPCSVTHASFDQHFNRWKKRYVGLYTIDAFHGVSLYLGALSIALFCEKIE